MLLILKTISVTIATVDIDGSSTSRQIDDELFNWNLGNLISRQGSSEQSHYFKIVNLITNLERKEAQPLGFFNKLSHEEERVDAPISSEEAKVRRSRPRRLLSDVEENGNWSDGNLRNETFLYGMHKRRRRRRKRYVKFPTKDGGRFNPGKGHGRPFGPPSSNVAGESMLYTYAISYTTIR